MVSFICLGATVRASTHTVCSSGCDFTSIQAAVDHSVPGDTITLGGETFYETVVVDTWDLTMAGAGPDETIVNGGGSGPVLDAPFGVTLSGLTIENGGGHGIVGDRRAISLDDCVVRDHGGWGIYSHGYVEITNTLIIGNGGGIRAAFEHPMWPWVEVASRVNGSVIRDNEGSALSTGQPTVEDSLITENGAGILAHAAYYDGHATISNSVISRNGSGLRISGGLEAAITNCVIWENGSGLDVRTHGKFSHHIAVVDIDSSYIARNRSDGLALGGCDGDVDAQVIRTTIADNRGAGVVRDGCLSMGLDFTMSNSTVSGNAKAGIALATEWLGSPPRGSIRSSTIVNNRAFGLAIPNRTDFAIESSIVANNWPRNCRPSFQFGELSAGHNLSSDASCGFLAPGDLQETDPLLLPLADNGGSTPTCALAPGSPAIDAAGLECEATDQRGESRPQDGDGDGTAECDIGAFETTNIQR
jgi:hypothetical protein